MQDRTVGGVYDWGWRRRTFSRVLAVLLSSALLCFAQTTDPPAAVSASDAQLAKLAADPIAPLIVYNLKDVYASSFYGLPGSGHAFVFQPVIPFRAWGRGNLFRATVNYSITGPRGRTLDNVAIFDLVAFKVGWG